MHGRQTKRHCTRSTQVDTRRTTSSLQKRSVREGLQERAALAMITNTTDHIMMKSGELFPSTVQSVVTVCT